MSNIEQELFEDNLKDTVWIGEVVDIDDPLKTDVLK